MGIFGFFRFIIPFGVIWALAANAWGQDYETFPELRPEQRCIDDDQNRFDPLEDGSQRHPTIAPIHCQKLFWDLPAAPRVGFLAAGSTFAADAIPRWPNGLTDRIPPIWIYDPDEDGVAEDCDPAHPSGAYADNPACEDGVPDGFESIPDGLTAAEVDRTALCPVDGDPHSRHPMEIPWWRPILDEDRRAVYGPDPTHCTSDECIDACEAAIATGDPDTIDAADACGALFEVSCRRGSRSYYGPWQIGTDPNTFDDLAYGIVRYENTERLDIDYANWPVCTDPHSGEEDPDCVPEDPETHVNPRRRLEWNTGTEIYNHFGSHHMTVWNAGNSTCNNTENPEAASDMEQCGDGYQYAANPHDTPDEEGGPGRCWSGDIRDRSCPNSEFESSGNAFRNGTQLPGRIHVQLPDGRAAPGLEDQLWPVEHHAVTQLPAGSYGLTELANFREQKGGLVNTSCSTPFGCEARFGTEPGEIYGGGANQGIFQYFSDPHFDPTLKPLSVMFEVLQDLATTWYPPFTWNIHQTVWYPPFDAAIGLIAHHTHHRTVRSYTDVLPANPVRLGGIDPACGGSANVTNGGAPPEHIYENTEWEDARVCVYWNEPDGPLVVRKGQAVKTTCYVNNGVTPEAIKNGLVAGSAVESLRAQDGGESIPRHPGGTPVDLWKDAFAQSPVGTELLYGTHPPDNYRVKYQCGPAPNFSFAAPLGIYDTGPICASNPAVDGDGDYVDGPYLNEEQCGEGGWCNPATIVFANVGEEEMCIPVFMYWPLDRIVNGDGSINEDAMEHVDAFVESGDPENLDRIGTPGRVWPSPSDAGGCSDGSDDSGVEIENPNSVTGAGDCSIGL